MAAGTSAQAKDEKMRQGAFVEEATGIYASMAKILMETDFGAVDLTKFRKIGTMNSHMYRAKIESAMKELSQTEQLIVIALTVAVKNKDRILNTLNNNPDMKKAAWHLKVRAFFVNKCVQYVSNSGNKVPVVKIPESFPPISALCYIAINRECTAEDFLKNLWAAQLDLDDDLMAKQKAWEMDFWNNIVKSSKNSNRPEDVELKFNETFYNTKAADTYPLLFASGARLTGTKHSEATLVAYIAAVKDSLPASADI
jgi:hypothetical protein